MTQIWFVSLVLVTLGQHLYRKPRPFTVSELFAWELLCRKKLPEPESRALKIP